MLDAEPNLLQTVGNGGAEGTRTPYLVVANDALYQMSYDPIPLRGAIVVA